MFKISSRILSLVLALLIVLSFGACGTNNSENDTTGQTTVDNATTTVETTKAPADPLGKYEQPVTITRVIRTAGNTTAVIPEGESYENNRWTKAIEDNLNIKLETLWTADATQYDTKMSVTLASGDMPDIINTSQYNFILTMKDADVLADLTQSWNEYAGPEIKALAEKKPDMFNAGVLSGKLLTIPNLSGSMYQQISSLWIRKDWMDNLGITPPKTMADVLKIAEMFTTMDPDKNGKNDTYGLALQKDIYGFFAEIFGFAQGYHAFLTEEVHQYWVKDSNDKYVYGATQPEAKNALLALQDLYKKGYIAKDFAVMDYNKLVEEFVAGKVGMTFGQSWLGYWPFTDLVKKDLKAEFRPYAIPSVDDKPVVLGAAWPINDYWAVSKTCQNPEALIKMANLYKKLNKVEPKTYNTTEDGKAVWGLAIMAMDDWDTMQETIDLYKEYREDPEKPRASLKEKGFMEQEIQSKINTIETIIKWIDQRDPAAYGTDAQIGPFGAGTIAFKDYFLKGLTMLNPMRGGESETFVQKGATLKAMEVEAFTKIIMGEPIDSFDTFVQQWNAQGGEQITNEFNAAKAKSK